MTKSFIVEQLEKALAHIQAGEHREAQSALSPLAAHTMEGVAVPRARFVREHLAEGRVETATVELETLLAIARLEVMP